MAYRGAEDKKYKGTLENFITDQMYGIDLLIHYYNLWADRLIRKDRIICIKYENIRRDTKTELKYITDFLNIPWNLDNAEKSIVESSFDSMKKLEANKIDIKYSSSNLNIFGSGDLAEPNAYHVREGKIFGYKKYLSPELQHIFLDKIYESLHPVYGYSNTTNVGDI